MATQKKHITAIDTIGILLNLFITYTPVHMKRTALIKKMSTNGRNRPNTQYPIVNVTIYDSKFFILILICVKRTTSEYILYYIKYLS